MKTIVALSIITAVSLSLAACTKSAAPAENNTVATDNIADAIADTNAAMADANAAAPLPMTEESASNAM